MIYVAFHPYTLQDEKGKNISFDIRVSANISNEVESLLICAIRIAKGESSLCNLERLTRDSANRDIWRWKPGFTACGAHLKNPEVYAQGRHQNCCCLAYQGTSCTANIQQGVSEHRAYKNFLPQIPAVLHLMEWVPSGRQDYSILRAWAEGPWLLLQVHFPGSLIWLRY